MKPKSLIRFALSLLLAVAILVTALPQPVQAASDSTTAACASTHIVVKGETTASIANLYGMPWGDIARANSLKKPYNLNPGQKLCIPYKKGQTPIKGTITITSKGDKLTINASNFKDTFVYFVKAKDVLANNAPWFKIGGLTVAKNKKVQTTTYTLPKDLRKSTVLSVCLKNVYSDDLTCYSVPRTS
jgi:murein DD-endopeptidase MepM/ murein hydrolase activator NlpD